MSDSLGAFAGQVKQLARELRKWLDILTARKQGDGKDQPGRGSVACERLLAIRQGGGASLLEVRNVSKSFGGTRALSGVSLGVERGEIVALLGENGAGKSTLIKILAGVYSLDEGAIGYDGQDTTRSLRTMPVAFIHQDLGLIEWMTVAENICLTLGYPRKRRLIDWDAARQRAARALALLDADIHPDVRINALSRTDKSLVAIARALAAEAEILVLDEPTASLPADEVARLFKALRHLRDRNVGMIYVSHRLDEVFEIGDRVVVLRDGKVAGERRIGETTPEEVILLIVGREPSQVFRRPPQRQGAPRLVIQGMTVGVVGPVDAEIHGGEIVGLVGLRGAGQEQVGRALFGLRPETSGRVLLDGRPLPDRLAGEDVHDGHVSVSRQRLYRLVELGDSQRHVLSLEPEPGISGYAFTFG